MALPDPDLIVVFAANGSSEFARPDITITPQVISVGPRGPKGDPGTSGTAPPGGTTGQQLVKTSNVDGAVGWQDNSASNTTFAPAGSISATNVQAAVIELRDDTNTALAEKVSRGELVYDVRDYGALGDGSTDDTAAIQAALDAAYAAGGGEVHLPPRIHIVDPNPGLQVKSNTTFAGTVGSSALELKAGSTHSDNIVKSEGWTNVTIRDMTINGNRTNQPGSPGSYTHTQYGLYLGAVTKALVSNVHVTSTTGVGIHIYNSSGVTVEACESTDNNYHGYEFEQDSGCHLIGSQGSNNLVHGVLTSPGEVSGTGSKGNSFSGNTFDGNGNYGIATNAANADVSAWLNEGNIYECNTVTNNAFYGINFYKQDKHIVTNNYVAGNGYFGLYAFESQNNVVENNTFVGNSAASNGAYDEIALEGYTSNSSHPSRGNIVAGNQIIIQGTNKARYAINEANAGDGPNIIYGNNIPNAGTSGRLNVQNASTMQFVDNQADQNIGGNKIFTGGVGVAANSVTPSSSLGGIDAPFGSTSPARFLSKYGMQLVTSDGAFDAYISDGTNQNNTFSAYVDHVSLHSYPMQDVADPTNAQDAATKSYVDAHAGGTPGGSTTQVQYNSGGTFAGAGMYYDSANDELGLGAAPVHASPFTSHHLQIHDANGNNSDVLLRVAGSGAGSYSGAGSAGTLASPTTSALGNVGVELQAFNYGATTYKKSAEILLGVDLSANGATTPSDTNMPGTVVIRTTPAGSTSPATGLVVTNKQYTGVATTTPLSTLDVSGSLGLTSTAETASFTADATTSTYACDATSGAINVTLPSASTSRRRVYIFTKTDVSANAMIVNGVSLAYQGGFIIVQSNGTIWLNLATSNVPEAAVANLTTDLAGKQPLDSDLTAVAGLSSTGIISRTGTGTAAVRTLTAGSSKATVTNGDGVSGNPTVDVTDATTSQKGALQLAGDLGGSAASPAVKSRAVTAVVGLTTGDYPVSSYADASGALAAALAAADVIQLRNGIYALTTDFQITASNKTIVGESEYGTSLRMNTGVNKSVVTTGSNTGIISNVVLRNLTIDQQGSGQTAGGGIVVTGIQNWTLENITLAGSFRFGFLAQHQGSVANKTGTVTFTNGSTTFTGSGTSFTTDLAVGSIVKDPTSGDFARIAQVVSNTSARLDYPWTFATSTGVTYKVIPPNSNNRFINVKWMGTLDSRDNAGFGLCDYSIVQNCYSTASNGAGCGFVPDHAKGMQFVNCVAANCGNAGFSFETGEDIVTTNCVSYGAGTGNGFQLISGGLNCRFVNCVAYSNASHGFAVNNNSTSFPVPTGNSFQGISAYENGGYGFRNDGANKTYVEGRLYNNVSGGYIQNTASSVVPTDTFLDAIRAYDDRATKQQARGIWLVTGSNTTIRFPQSQDSDHVTAGITDAATGTTIITAKGGNLGVNNNNPANSFNVNVPTTAAPGRDAVYTSSSSTSIPFAIQAAPSQTGNLMELQSSAGNNFALMTSGGLWRGPAASAAAPTFSFAVDGATGFYRPAGAANTVRVTTAANDRVQIDTNRTTFMHGMQYNRTAVGNVNYTILPTDFIVAYTSLSATRTATLPTAASVAGQTYLVVDEAGTAASHSLVVACNGSETINGASTYSVSTNYGYVAVYSDGANWHVCANPSTGAGGSGISRTIAAVTSSLTGGASSSTDYVYLLGSGASYTQPAASGNGNLYTLRNTTSSSKSVARSGSDTLEGATSLTVGPNSSVDLISDGTSAWYVI